MSPSSYFPELSTPDPEAEARERADAELINAIFKAAADAKKRVALIELFEHQGIHLPEEQLERIRTMDVSQL